MNGHDINLERYPALKQSREFSSKLYKKLREDLAGKLSTKTYTVATCGSLARCEASECSDVDFLIVPNGDDDLDIADDKATLHGVMMSNKVSLPNPDGVFAQQRGIGNLIGQMGKKGEEADVLAKRMLLLMESKPLFSDDNYCALINSIFEKYAKYVIAEPNKEFLVLLNDVIRYFRYICLNYEHSFGHQNEKWPIRNVKLRHSRVLIYFGLLALIGESSKHGTDKVVWLKDKLALTPLERVALVYNSNRDDGIQRVFGLYNTFVSKISEESNRQALNNMPYDSRYASNLFVELKANSDAFITELSRFVYARRGQWSNKFFEYLLF